MPVVHDIDMLADVEERLFKDLGMSGEILTAC
jgi:hypothetical protein